MTYTSWQRWKGIMKAQPFEEKRLNRWEPPYIVQPKYDGFRCRAVPITQESPSIKGSYILLSSEENVIHSVPHIVEQLNNSDISGVELDGEIYNHQIYLEGGFDLISSIVSRTVNLHPRSGEMQFHVFDYVGDKSQGWRLIELNNNKDRFPRCCYVSPYWMCNSLDEIMEVYDELMNYSYEGIIVRNILAPYERKRSLWVMKFKPKQEDIYEIIGAVEEVSINGVPKDRLGALVCRGSDGFSFSVGTGFNDEMRSILWADKDDLKGKKAKVQYQHVTSGKGIPRFPVFVEVIDGTT